VLFSFLGVNGLFGGETTLDEIVVTATRIKEKSFDVSAPVEVVTPRTLEINNPATAAQPLEELPGVSLSSAGMWEVAPVIRGLGGNRILVLIDGDRENNLWAGRAPLTPFVDVGNIERIEVIKGPGSVLYGTDALGGVINIITKTPDFAQEDKWTFLNSTEGRYSSVDDGRFGRYNLSGGGYGFGLAVSGRDSDDYENGDGHNIDNSQYETVNIDFKGRYFINDNNDLSFSVRSNNIDDMGVPQQQGAEYSHFTQFDTNTYKLAYHGSNLGLIDDLQLRTWYVDQKRKYKGKMFSSSKPMHTLKSNDIDSSAIGSSLQTRIDLGKNNRLITGVEYVHEDCDGDEEQIKKKNNKDITAKILTFKPVPDAKRDHFGVFAQDELDLGDSFTILAGLRYDYFSADADDVIFKTESYDPTGQTVIKVKSDTNHFKSKSDDAVTFNLGMLYALNENIHLTTNFSSGFRAPDIFELYSTRGGSYILLGDPDLDPEYSYNVDTGFKLNYRRLRGSFSAFYNRVNDYIDLVNRGATFAGQEAHEYVNISDAELYGADGSLEFDILKQLTIFGNLAYVEGRERHTHSRLNKIPPLNGLLGLRWKGVSGGLKYWFEFSSNMYDSQDHPADGEEKTPGYALFNLRSGVKFDYAGMKDITLSLNVENLFDKKYRSHLNYEDFLTEPGLNVITSLKIYF
jgi:hemoglobin/transferrin/lactoferrin receptor protein